MLDFSSFLDLPLIFVAVIAFAVFMYVLLDGFDLGVGILFPFAPSDDCRNKMMNSIAPFWDGNETWLVLGGGGLLAAFPLAYSIIMPTFYLPIIFMLLGLIFRGVAFEFRFKSASSQQLKLWDYSFHFGSLIASFFQGVILGSLIQGDISSRGSFGWLNAFSITVGIALIAGYALLGSTWLILKTHDKTAIWARHTASYILLFVAFFIILVSIWSPFLNTQIHQRWFTKPDIFYLILIPLATIVVFLSLIRAIKKGQEKSPFLYSILIFVLCYIGLVQAIFPYIIPYEVTFWQAAAAPTSLSLILIGVIAILPIILAYTFYSYYVFRGKAKSDSLY